MNRDREVRVEASNLQLIGRDMVLQDFSASGISVWHFADGAPLTEGELIFNDTLLYTVKWVKQVGDKIYRYGAIWVGA